MKDVLVIVYFLFCLVVSAVVVMQISSISYGLPWRKTAFSQGLGSATFVAVLGISFLVFQGDFVLGIPAAILLSALATRHVSKKLIS